MQPLWPSQQPQHSSLSNFAYLPHSQGSLSEISQPKPEEKPRKAPGTRGPVPRSCTWCRRLRAKCVFKNGGRVGEENCNACIKKGIECKFPEEISHRPIPAPRVEQAIVATQLSSAAATYLFDLFFDSTKAGVESNILPILFHDSRSLQGRFNLAGRKLDLLTPSEQILESAQEQADLTAIWRRPSLPNFTNLLLLFSLTANGNFNNTDAQHYLVNACNHFPHLFPNSFSLTDQVNGKQGWAAYTLAAVDLATALENGTAPHLSDQAFATFPTDRTPYEPPFPAFLPHFSPDFELYGIKQGTDPLVSYLILARTIAQHFSRLEVSAVNQHDYEVLWTTFKWMDSYENWAAGCIGLYKSQELPSIVKTSAQSAIVLQYIPCLMLELSVREHLRRRVNHLRAASENIGAFLSSTLASYLDTAEARCRRSLCVFLKHTRNCDGIYLLSASTGYLASINRLSALATTLCESLVEDWELFPVGAVDKLASTTFLLKTLQSAQAVYASPILAQSIVQLEETKAALQIESGYSGDMALILVVSVASTGSEVALETQVPNVPSSLLIEAAVSMAGGT